MHEALIQKVVRTTLQTLYGKGLFDGLDNADEVSKGFLFVERRKPDLEEVNDFIQ